MKHVAVALLLLLVAGISVPSAFGQATTPDTILRLKNGQEVRGTLVEVKNGVYVLTLADGKTALYPTSDVEAAERLLPPPPAATAATTGTRERSEVGTTTPVPKVKGQVLLAPGHRVWVRPPEKHPDIAEILGDKIREWGRWKVVDKQEEGDLVLRLVLTGSNAWGRGSIVAVLEDPSDQAQLWRSEKSTGNRTIFHGYASPYQRATIGIMDQMKVAAGGWPRN